MGVGGAAAQAGGCVEGGSLMALCWIIWSRLTGEALAIANTLNEAEREEIKLFLQALVGGQTKVVLGSRSDEAWLQDVFSHAGKV